MAKPEDDQTSSETPTTSQPLTTRQASKEKETEGPGPSHDTVEDNQTPTGIQQTTSQSLTATQADEDNHAVEHSSDQIDAETEVEQPGPSTEHVKESKDYPAILTTTTQPTKQAGKEQIVRNTQTIDARGATISHSIVGVQGNVNITKNIVVPEKKPATKEEKDAAINKHQDEHIKSLPENLVLYDTKTKNQLPDVHPIMHEYEAYEGDGPIKHKHVIPPYIQQALRSLHKQPVFFNKILNVTSPKKFITLVGPPGSGKTTLSKQLAKLSQPNQSAKFLLRFMDLNYEQPLTCKQLFVDSLCPELDDKTKENAFQWMIENQDKCVFVFDGYDQATFSLEKMKPRNASYDEPLPIAQLVANLCGKKFFKNSLLIFTSRPHSMLKIPFELRPDVTIHVDDLSTEDMKKLFRALAGDKADELWEILSTKALQLFSLCHNPLLLQFIVFAVLHKGFKKVKTVTEVFQTVLEQLRYSEHATNEDMANCWEPLAKMAFKGMYDETVVFTKENLGGFDITAVQDIIIAYARKFHFPTKKLFDGDQRFYFSHQMLQEVLAAKYICEFMSDEEFNKIVPEVTKGGHWSMVRRFLCGLLLGDKSKDVHSQSFKTVQHQATPTKRQDKSSIFYRLLVEQLRKSNGTDLLELLIDLQECSDKVVKSCAKYVPAEINLSGALITLSGAYALVQILMRFNRPVEKLDLSDKTMVTDSMKLLFTGISKMKVKIKKLVLYNNLVGDEGIQHLKFCLDRIESLNLRDCDITSVGVQIICAELKKRITAMKELDLSGNCMEDEGVRHLASCLEKMEVLKLINCDITPSRVEILSKGLKQLEIPMKELDLSTTDVGDEGTRHLASCINKIERLVLRNCTISSTGVQIMCMELKKRIIPMKMLDLSVNEIGDEGATYLKCCLDKIEMLLLDASFITCLGVQVLSDGLKNLATPIKMLSLGGNMMGDECIWPLTSCLDKIERLVLWECNITSAGVVMLTEALALLTIPMMKELDLSSNDIQDEDVSHLISCLDKIEKLKLDGCFITDAGKKAICDALQNFPNSTVDYKEEFSLIEKLSF